MRGATRIIALFLLAGACSGGASGSAPPTGRPSGGPASATAFPSAPPSAPSSVQELTPTLRISLRGGTPTGLEVADGALWVSQFEDGLLTRLDPVAGREVGTVELGSNATSLTALGGTLWVAGDSMGTGHALLVGVDASSGRVTARVELSGACCQVAFAAGSVWAVDPAGTLQRVDPKSGQVVGSTSVDVDNVNGHVDLAGDDRGLWVGSDTTPLTRIHPATGDVAGQVDVGGGIPMVLGGDLLWGAGPDHLWALDVAAGQIRTRFGLDDTIETFSLALTEDAIWLAVRRPGHVGTIRTYDLVTHSLTGQGPVALPARVAFAFGGVWVLDAQSNELLRFDP